MRLALIADLHGNDVALEAVLADLAGQRIDQILCLGDVASTGPQPREVIRRLQEIGCPAVLGNMDAWLLRPEPKAMNDRRKQCWQDIDLWCAEQLSEADRAYLHTFQPTITCTLAQGKHLLCYHGSPRSYSERIVATTSEEDLEQAFAQARAPIMAGGHTHVQLFRRYQDCLLLNPGSVGLAIDRLSPLHEIRQPAWAEYAIIECDGAALHVELRRIPFDLQAFLQAMHRSGMPHAAWWASCWREA